MAAPSMTLTSSPPILCRNSQSTELFQGRSAITEVEHSSSLFTSPSMRCATYLSSEPVEIAYSRRGVGVGGGGSHYVDPSLSMDAWNDSLHISASTSLKLRERGSPVSVFQGPGSGQSSGRLLSAREKAVTLSNSSETRSHLSLASDILRPLRRFEGFRTNLEEGPSPHPANPTKEQEDYPPSVETRLSEQDLARLKRAVGSSSLSKLLCEKPFPDTLPPCTMMVGNILKDAQARHRIFNDDLVVKAFHEAAKAHHGQLRANGDPYLVHCVETATILASVGANKVVVAAGLLHDTIDDAAMSYEELNCMFGAEVADLVKGVSRLSRLSQLARDNNTASRTEEADRMHTMFLAMTDVRVVLIKLADRLHNMRTLGALPTSKQQHIAEETLEIFAPLANRLGIWSWKAEIEDLCFKHLKPRDHQELAMKLAEGFRASTIMSAVHSLDQALQNNNIRYHDLCGRPKNLYSIYLKTVRKGRDLNQIYDLRGLRLILEREEDCFKALKVVHQLWPRVPGKLKDYITEPKTNGYRSLHTVVMGEDGLPLEVQIRSKEMHRQAEFGVAAHWRYKEGDTQLSASVLQMVEWVRWVLTWQNEIMDTKLRITSGSDLLLRPPCPFPLHKEGCPYMHCTPPMSESDPVYVILLDGDKMTVQELPGGSTVADLLHSNGTPGEELWPAINYKVVDDMDRRLEMGDLVDMNRSVSDESLREYREKIKRMFGHCEEPEGNAVLHSSWAKPSVALA